MHSFEDDVVYERVRHMPHQAPFFAIHRKLSWQCEKKIKQFEKDLKMCTIGISREQTLIKTRLNKINQERRQLTRQKTQLQHRRNSCPGGMLLSNLRIASSNNFKTSLYENKPKKVETYEPKIVYVYNEPFGIPNSTLADDGGATVPQDLHVPDRLSRSATRTEAEDDTRTVRQLDRRFTLPAIGFASMKHSRYETE